MFRSGTLCHEHEIWPLLAVTNHQVSRFTVSLKSLLGSNENHSVSYRLTQVGKELSYPSLVLFRKRQWLGNQSGKPLKTLEWLGFNLRRPSMRETVPCGERTKVLAYGMQHSWVRRVCSLHILHILHQLSCTQMYICIYTDVYARACRCITLLPPDSKPLLLISTSLHFASF